MNTLRTGARSAIGMILLQLLLGIIHVQACVADSDVYDYIVVGAGTAGLAVANRLSENPATKVLVIEAGESVLNNSDVYGTDSYGKALNTKIDWQFKTTVQSFANGKQEILHAGKAVGGTSTINGMAYTRLVPAQIDGWGALGNSGWDWLSFFPYYYKSERFQVPSAQMQAAGASYCSSCHGYNGLVKNGYTRGMATDNIPHLLNSTIMNLGIPYNVDVNSNYMRGFTIYPRAVDTALNVREDAARAYYWPFASRNNLVLKTNTLATDIVWNSASIGSTLKAEGVRTINAGTPLTYFATKEVLLAAGSLKTPQILELSGVGNPTILRNLGIPVRLSLPAVGENLRDQINNAASFSSNAKQPYTGQRGYALYANASDIFGTSKSSVAASVRSALSSYASKVAAASNGASTSSQLLSEFTTQYNLLFNSQVPMAEIIFYTSGTGLASQYWGLLPFARGNVHITSVDPTVQPAINPNYWMTAWDSTAQVAIARYIRRLYATAPLKSIITGETYPGYSKVPANANDAAWTAWLRSTYRPNYHAIGTMAMKPREKGGAVSSRLVVYGTENVRVVDASIWPTQVTGHLCSTVYAVAEKAADMIKEDN